VAAGSLLRTVTADPTHSPSQRRNPSGLYTSLDPTKLLDSADRRDVLTAPITPRDEFRVTPITPLETAFRHAGWKHLRRQTFDCLCRCGASASRIDRFANCGSGCCVEANEATGETRFSANYCHDRLCRPCGAARSANVTRALIAEAGTRTVRFVTFTLRHSQTPLNDQIDRLYRSFAALRRRQWFMSKCSGGAAVLEVKLGREGLWHVHLHCLLLGTFLDQRALSAEWHSVTGDSFIVDVRRVDRGQEAIRYCASYVGKPVDASIYQNPDKLDEAARALHGRRVVNTWGEWARLNLEADTPTDGNWVVVGRLGTLVRDAAAGDVNAQLLLAGLCNRGLPGRPPDG
jgi:hypothetical protein